MTEPSTAAEPTPGLFARFLGVIVSPGPTFAAALKAPSPYGILFLVAVVLAVAGAAPQLSPAVRDSMVEMQVEAQERFSGQPVSDEAYARMQQFARYNIIGSVIGAFVMTPIAALFFTALFWGLFNAILGGTASFKDVLTVVAHGMVIMALGALISAPIVLMQGTVDPGGPFNLGPLVPMLDDEHLIARVMGSVSIFMIWQTIVVAIGLGVLYRRKTGPIAMGLLVAYVASTAVFVSVFGRFMGL
jgi:hypothetical protein